ncbi:hypothetical protein [Undibacterium pigrum]|uniref:Uncharacterized protein n=1 Tax=Undibacterium pigrum TaxID=401470 RepID=A0A318IQH8_9BURK|nr:hypothetical protein [Undibacterium pigrum]PXX37759.1 hypothetical protein DFR42_1159 [Undibacterium pigrum]
MTRELRQDRFGAIRWPRQGMCMQYWAAGAVLPEFFWSTPVAHPAIRSGTVNV